MKRVFECFQPEFSPYGKRWMFIVLILMFMICVFANLSRPNVEYLYFINFPFCWDTVTLGLYGGIRTCLWDAGSMIMIPLFQRFASDEITALTGFVTTIASLIIEGLANSGGMLYWSAIASVGCVVTMPVVRSMLSRMTPSNKQGSIFAGIAGVESFFSLVGTVTIGLVYDTTVNIYRGLTFLIWAGFGLSGLILSIILVIGMRRNNKTRDTQEAVE